jgi:uncharacterized protein (DUF2384 family)
MLSPALDALLAPDGGHIDPQAMADALRLSLADLARIAGVHRNTLSRAPGSPAAQERLGAIASILADAADLLGGDARRAVVWFRFQPIASLGGDTAEELVARGQARLVREHLKDLREGAYA